MPEEPNLPTISVIIANYNGKKHLKGCLASLKRVNYPEGQLELLVVDNDSEDGSKEWLRRHYSDVQVVEAKSNLGFGPACNLGAQKSQGEFLAFLNNDATVHPQWLRELLNSFLQKEPFIATTSALILDSTGKRIDFAGGAMTFYAEGLHLSFGKPYTPEEFQKKPFESPFPCGASMLIPKELFLKAGCFDERFFFYYEDMDLGWRLSNMGYKHLMIPTALCYHLHHGSSMDWPEEKQTFFYERNRLFTIFNNTSEENLPRLLSASLILMAHRMLEAKETQGPWQAYSESALEVLKGMDTIGKRRSSCQAKRKRDDKEVFSTFKRPLYLPPSSSMRMRQLHEKVTKFFELNDLFSFRPMVSAVIPTHKGQEVIERCLSSLYKSPYEPKEVIVVDNASRDGTQQKVAASFPQVKLIRSEKNLGFAGGSNLGLRHSSGDIILFLNDDAYIRDDLLEQVVNALKEEPRAAILGCKLLYPDGKTFQHAGGILHPSGLTRHRGYGEEDRGQYEEREEVEYVTGACMAVWRWVLEDFGLMDEGFYPGYYEEVDLCQRVIKAGLKVIYEPGAVAFHQESVTSKKSSFGFFLLYHKHRWEFVLKHFSPGRMAGALRFDLWWLRGPIPREQRLPLILALGITALKGPFHLTRRLFRRWL